MNAETEPYRKRLGEVARRAVGLPPYFEGLTVTEWQCAADAVAAQVLRDVIGVVGGLPTDGTGIETIADEIHAWAHNHGIDLTEGGE